MLSSLVVTVLVCPRGMVCACVQVVFIDGVRWASCETRIISGAATRRWRH